MSAVRNNTEHVMVNMQQYANQVAFQAFIWVPLVLFIVVGCMACFMVRMDADKHKDTIVFAKFITDIKEKPN